ncbi:PE family protein [Mycobacterium haemophilum DSM 44634]|nr:PE family protein [Mycobacterium haemophilum DSM 44634]
MSHPFPHPFVTVEPGALGAATGDLQGVGAQLAASNAAAACATTGIVPAAADEVSALNALHYSAQGELYQVIAAQAAVMHQQLADTLATGADSYVTTEATNQTNPADIPQIPQEEIANLPAGLNFEEIRQMYAQPYGPPVLPPLPEPDPVPLHPVFTYVTYQDFCNFSYDDFLDMYDYMDSLPWGPPGSDLSLEPDLAYDPPGSPPTQEIWLDEGMDDPMRQFIRYGHFGVGPGGGPGI